MTQQNSQHAPIRLLLVEDNPVDLLLWKELLSGSKTRFEFEVAPSMESALERLGAGGIDVVLSDLTLPDSHGIETFKKIHAKAPQVPVIVLSGLDDEGLAVQTVEKGAQDYLVKDRVDRHLLVRAIRYALKRAEAERALSEERNLLRSVIDNQPDSIYVKDARCQYLLDNLAHMRALGVTSMEEVIGKTAFDFFPPKIAEQFQHDDEKVMNEGKPIVNCLEPVIDEKGEKHWLSTTKVPLRNQAGEIIGIVGIGRDITDRKRAEEKIANYHEQLRAKNAQMEDDLRMASEVQQAFLPQQLPDVPGRVGVNRLRFFSRYLPTGAVGGDFFHILPLSETTAGVFICDVMGHGVRAALVTAIQRALVEELVGVANNPGEFLLQINRALLSILRRARTPLFVSAFYLFADAATGRVRYSSAGHPMPLHIRRAADTVEALSPGNSKPGPALGVFDEPNYETLETQLEARDLVLLFTDGLFEVEGPDGELFDQKKLQATVRTRMHLPVEALFDATLAEVKQFSADEKFIDDVCLVAMEFEGGPKDPESGSVVQCPL